MNKKAYTFSDVLIEPQYSEVLSRKNVNLGVNLHYWELQLPVIASNMKTICGPKMAIEMAKQGGMGILHRFNTTEKAVEEYLEVVHSPTFLGEDSFQKNKLPVVAVSVGVQEEDKRRIDMLYAAGAKICCIDVAHGHHILVKNMVEWIRKSYSVLNLTIIAGNIATKQAVLDLTNWGVNIVKVGIGPSPVCLTRSNTGVGVPQLYALDVIRQTISEHKLPTQIIADGGINSVGSIAKALKFADAVMLGTMLSGTTETPGNVYKSPDGQFYKVYGGSASGENKGENKFVEGMTKSVPFRGKVKYILKEIKEGLQSACSYCDANNLKEFQERCEFIEISEGAMKESKMG